MTDSSERKKIWVHYTNGNFYGPGMVVENLFKGFRKLGDEIEVVSKPARADYVGCLQNPGELFRHMPEKTLMGPNLFVLPPEAPYLCSKFKNFVVPSHWVKNKYEQYQEMSQKNISVWPVGIDTEEWSDSAEKKTVIKDFFIYQKNTPNELIEKAKLAFTGKGLSCSGVITYGKYNKEDLKSICRSSRFAVLCTKTESQGIAYMSILSTNTPCYVINDSLWKYENGPGVTAEATSVPYFDSRCGLIVSSNDKEFLSSKRTEEFLGKFESYESRQYILDNHTLELSAKSYVSLLRTCFNEA
jgi:hypothetical protein